MRGGPGSGREVQPAEAVAAHQPGVPVQYQPRMKRLRKAQNQAFDPRGRPAGLAQVQGFGACAEQGRQQARLIGQGSGGADEDEAKHARLL